VHAYLGYLEDAFLVYSLWLVTDSERRRLSNPRKIYPVDPALIPIFDRSGRLQPSKALETVVFLELLRRGAEVGYVRTREGLEVDFLARWPSGRLELIQVCAEVQDASTLERELQALLAAAKEFPMASLKVLSLAPETLRGLPNSIQGHDASLWLLSPTP
jgi:predicted AAA+ superfamily ATPase